MPREKDSELVSKMYESEYLKVFKAIRSDAKLVDFDAYVRCIRRTRT